MDSYDSIVEFIEWKLLEFDNKLLDLKDTDKIYEICTIRDSYSIVLNDILTTLREEKKLHDE